MLALQDRVRGGSCARDDPLRLRGGRRAAERRQVDARERARGREGRRHLRQAADHPARDPRDRDRRATRGSGWQLVLVDLPGVQSPRDALTERMQRRVEHELAESDAALFVLNGAERSGRRRPLHRRGARQGEAAGRGGREQGRRARRAAQTAEALVQAAALEEAGVDVREVVPVSALKGAGVDVLREALVAPAARGAVLLPGGAALRPAARGRAGRAGARAGAEAHARGGAALDRGAGRGAGAPRGRARPWCARCCGPRPSRRRRS